MNYVLLFKGGAVTTRSPKNGTINWIPEIGLGLHRVSRLNSTRRLGEQSNLNCTYIFSENRAQDKKKKM